MSALTMRDIDSETAEPSLAYSLGLCSLSLILQTQSILVVNEETFRRSLSKQQCQFGQTSITVPMICLCSGTNHPVCMNLF
jgi:hypothetical protein